jgi:formylglycine-generating enzyme required for sulfatase activity
MSTRPVRIQVGKHKLELSPIRPGSFWREDLGQVELTRPLLVARTAVSRDLWRELMGADPADDQNRNHPMTEVSWYDALRFCNVLSKQQKLPPAYRIGPEQVPKVAWNIRSPGFRLLTEAEWEHAARAGQKTRYSGGDDAENVAWFAENATRTVVPKATITGRRGRARQVGCTQPMGRKSPNDWGLHGMSGNVWEWVWDYGAPFPSGDQLDPTGPKRGTTRVCRGGSWRSRAIDGTLDARLGARPVESADDRGFRYGRFFTEEGT